MGGGGGAPHCLAFLGRHKVWTLDLEAELDSILALRAQVLAQLGPTTITGIRGGTSTSR